MRKGGGLATAMNATVLGSDSGSSKETIILAHGYGGDQSVWDKTTPYLVGRGHQVVLFDWCFSGAIKDPTLYDPARYTCYDAFADDLISLADEMELKSTVFVGHSMSGMIGCIASIKRPDLFRRLVLVSASPRFINLEDYEGGFEIKQVEGLLSSIESNFEEWASSFASVVIDSSDPLSIKKFESLLQKMKPEVALSLAKTVFLSDNRQFLEKVETPCNIIQTRNDAVVPNSVAKYMLNKMIKIKGKCMVDIIETDGHFPQLTAHTQFVKVLDRILGC